MQDLWVFGYASLMWRPGFDVEETVRARLNGYHRSLCIHSFEHRGTRERPGLVMGLDRGGSCVGLALRVGGAKRDDVLQYLRERELVTHVYAERWLKVLLSDRRTVEAVTYVVDRSHEQYAGKLNVTTAVETVCGSRGKAGPNEDYVLNTAEHLSELKIRDRWLEAVAMGIRAKG
ncbi:MAG: gamma-glutamylcyclotransferase [Pseudomonadota bacterium]